MEILFDTTDYTNGLYEGADPRLALYNIMHGAAIGEIDISDEKLTRIFQAYSEVNRNACLPAAIDATKLDSSEKSDMAFALLDLLASCLYRAEDEPILEVVFFIFTKREILFMDLLVEVLKDNFHQMRDKSFFWDIMATALLYAPTEDPLAFTVKILSIIGSDTCY